jgi:hypothetical protein
MGLTIGSRSSSASAVKKTGRPLIVVGGGGSFMLLQQAQACERGFDSTAFDRVEDLFAWQPRVEL